MDKKDIISFFDRCAPGWDADLVRNDAVIEKILDNGGIREGIHVLDVACGTGVLFPDYLKRNVASVTGIDISPEMVKVAQGKFPQIPVLCGDVETATFDRKFDAIMVYNAFPHFPDPEALIRVLAENLTVGGRLSIAHGMSRAAIDNHHAGKAHKVSLGLMHEAALAELMAPYFEVDVVISDDTMYQVSGTRREGIVHSHGGHSHHHHHDHSHDHHHGTPTEELIALLRYTVSHNDAHAQELAELADQLRRAGKTHAYDRIMDAVTDFDMVNAKLDAVLKALQADEE